MQPLTLEIENMSFGGKSVLRGFKGLSGALLSFYIPTYLIQQVSIPGATPGPLTSKREPYLKTEKLEPHVNSLS